MKALPREPGNSRWTLSSYAFFFTTVLKSSSIKPTGNWCGKKSLTKTSEFAVHSERPEAPMKSCQVVLEDISCHYDAEKFKALEPCPENIHMTSSCQNNERSHLEEIELRQPIAWCRMKDELSYQLDNVVYSKLHTEKTITERLHLLNKTIYGEALKLFGQKRKSRFRVWLFSPAGPNTALGLLYRKTPFRPKSLRRLTLKNKAVFKVL